MKSISIVFTMWLIALQCGRAEQLAVPALANAFQKIAVDPEQTYRVRDLQFSRGDIKIYLNEGVLSFATPLAGRTVAAIFITQLSEAGDAEILLLPPRRSERASLASFIKSPNLDEHFAVAVFLFSDSTASELLSKIDKTPARHAPEVAMQNAEAMNSQLRAAAAESGIQLMEALLDNHLPEEGFFYAFIAGRDLGTFEVSYEPSAPEMISVGHPVLNGDRWLFQLWTAFQPRRVAPRTDHVPVLSDYHIDATIHKDLSISAHADFSCATGATTGRVLAFGLSDRLRVKSASIDGAPAEIFQPEVLHLTEQERGRSFLLVSQEPLAASRPHIISVRYEGAVIRQTGNGGYFVDERNVWYPYLIPMRTNFDLTFRFAPHLTLVSTGELVSEEVKDGMRVVHRRTAVPEGLAGFNLGDYKSSVEARGIYRVESYAEQKSVELPETIAEKARAVLDYYTKLWTPLPIHTLSVTPIAGTFGQGFPGLIYISTWAYMRPEDRPASLRDARQDTFFSEMLLPHEVAHQWWGNGVIPADYRTNWLLEAMANYSALQVLEHTRGAKAVDALLDSYRSDLLRQQDGKPVESFGPVDFGTRLIDTAGMRVWHDVVYEKGTWILHMLRQRLGDQGFRRMQLRLLEEFASKPVSNEEFRRVASEFVPSGQPDKDLALFFDTWIYGTGIPKLSLLKTSEGPTLELSGVADDFIADVPVQCRSKSAKFLGRPLLRWIRVSNGSNSIDKIPVGASCELPESSAFLFAR